MENNRNAVITLVVLVLVVLGLLWFANRDNADIIDGNGSPSPTSTIKTGTPGAGDYDDTPDTGAGDNTLLSSGAALSARAVLASRLGTTIGNVTITDVEASTWPNGCLGLDRQGEICTQALVEGYRVTMESGGQTYVYRTNSLGTSVRLEQ